MLKTREEVNQLIIDADKLIQQEKISEGLALFDKAKKLAIALDWAERESQISQMISDVHFNVKKRRFLEEKQKKIEENLKKQQDDENKLVAAQKRVFDKQQQNKQLKLDQLKQKKEFESQQSEKAYNQLEIGSKFVSQNQFGEGLNAFQEALRIFTEIHWSAEIMRTKELISDTKNRKNEYDVKLLKEKRNVETLQKSIQQENKIIDSEREKKILEDQKKNSINEEKTKKQSFENQLSDEMYDEISKWEKIGDEYLKQVKSGNILSTECPYPQIIEIYSQNYKKAKNLGWTNQANRFFEGISLYKEKMVRDQKLRVIEERKISKSKADQDYINKKIKTSKLLQQERQQKIASKRQEEELKAQQEQAIADEVLKSIDTIESTIKLYENRADRIPYECPYAQAIEIYKAGANRLKELGWTEQSQRLYDGMNTYREKLTKDQQYRESEANRIAKTKEEAEMLEKRATLSKQLQEEKQQKLLSQRQKEELKAQQEQAIADEVFKSIDAIESTIKLYENRADRIPYECPYAQAVEIYKAGANRLKELGWTEQSQRLYDGMNTYREKLTKDQQYRESEANRIAKTKEEAEMLEKRAALSKKLQEEKQQKLLSQRQEEELKAQQEQAIADEVFKSIDAIESTIKLYENRADRIPYECPYAQAIEIYKAGANRLKELGWTEQSQRLYDGMNTYREKLTKDQQYRESEANRIAKTKEEAEMLEKRAALSKQLQEEKQQKLLSQRQEEELKAQQEQAIADEVFKSIDTIESTIKLYENRADRIPYECPYAQAIEIYKAGANRLKELGWKEQSQRLYDGMNTYREKLTKDQQYRESEANRIAKTKEEAEMLEKRAALSKQLQEEKQQKLLSQRQKEELKAQQEQAIADEVFKSIDAIESTIKLYENRADRIPYECPYAQAIEIYKAGANRLKELGWTEQSQRLYDGMNTYREKLTKDQQYRESEANRIAKTKEEAEMLEKRAALSKQLQEEKQQKLLSQRQEEELKAQQEQAIADEVFKFIDTIESTIKLYENHADRIPYECPYAQAIEIYKAGANRLKEIGWTEQSLRLYDGMNTYREKLTKDQQYRESEANRIAKTKEEAEMLEKRAALSKQLQEEKQQKLLSQRQKEELKAQQEQAIADEVFNSIDTIESTIKLYENHADRISYECPYTQAIEIYKVGANRLKELGWTEQSQRLYDGMNTYREKLTKDQQYRESEAMKVLKTQKDTELLEKRSLLSHQLELEKKQQKLRHEQELREKARREKLLGESVFNEIDKIEAVIKKYESLEDIIPYECPYSEAINVYKKSANRLKDLGWLEQSLRLYDGMNTYREKLAKDKQFRLNDAKRIVKTKKDAEMLEKRAAISKKLQQEKEQRIIKEREAEKAKLDNQTTIANEIFRQIDEIEEIVKNYENNVDIFSIECPYSIAIEKYQYGSRKLQEIGWIEESTRLLDGVELYREKLIKDNTFRQLEKKRIEKIQEDAALIEQRVNLSKKLKEEREKIEEEQRFRELESKKQKESLAQKVFLEIDEIENQVKQYENQPDRIPYDCPYQKAINIYQENASKLRDIGWGEEAARLFDGVNTYQQKLAADKSYRKLEMLRVAKTKEESEMLERRAKLAKEIAEATKAKQKAAELQIEKENQYKKEQSDIAFELMDRGNLLANEHNLFDQAIEKFKEAQEIFRNIHWFAEEEKVLMQISHFRERKLQKQLEEQKNKEAYFKQQKEIEEIEQLAKLSQEIQNKKLKEEETRKRIDAEDKRKQAEIEFQKRIELSQKLEAKKLQERQKALQEEINKEMHNKQIHDECLELLEKARVFVTDQKIEAALKIYNTVIEKYASIDYFDGIRLTKDTILKVEQDFEEFKKQEMLKLKSIQERKEEEARLEKLILAAKEESERQKLEEQKRFLQEEVEREEREQIQDEIITLIADAGNLAQSNNFEKSLEIYQKALKLFDKISWPLKHQQVKSIINEVKSKKKTYEENLRLKKIQNEKLEAERKEFEEMMAQQERKRKSQEELAEQQSMERQIEIARQKEMGDNAYRMLELAENSSESRKKYLGLHYFHYALFNFKTIGWDREAKTTKKRFIGIYNSIQSPLIDVNELLMNEKLEKEFHIMNSLTQVIKWKNRNDFSAAQTEIKTIIHLVQEFGWVKSLKLLQSFQDQLKIEEKLYLKELESEQSKPSEEKANKLIKQATYQIKQLSYDKGINLAEEAHEMLVQIGRAREARTVEQELLRWKLKAEKALQKKNSSDRSESPKISQYLTDEERRRAIIDERKRRRREARKKFQK
ncbi:hypothetical protein NEF87_004034 [Candidatus Lokiarchaeum ossiferum]|uniref:Tetratricopeptide repeat protein n=1 Tax=Candidatus Lokiarchaeum ossiferum TaxID=2951803 RepID=A0ABY6HYW2_9ARCH|nr:hypothetical protein NEF87_004034 [Candidatus Lokiarchaeum sp. B-35]